MFPRTAEGSVPSCIAVSISIDSGTEVVVVGPAGLDDVVGFNILFQKDNLETTVFATEVAGEDSEEASEGAGDGDRVTWRSGPFSSKD